MSFSKNLNEVQRRIREAAQRAGRDPDTIRLVAVSKQVPLARIQEACAAGWNVFGENKVQEATNKIESLGSENVHWHFIGHLQKNKVKYIPGLFERVHSVDSLELAQRLHQSSLEHGLVTPVLIQVNVSGEESKSGVPPDELESLLACAVSLPGIAVKGLMTIPPYDVDVEKSRPFFTQLRELRDRMELKGFDGVSLDELSMGMSGDFEIAVEEGATWVRVGTALFGDRE